MFQEFRLNKTKWLFTGHLWPLLSWEVFLKAVVKINLSLKPNHHNQVKLVQIPDMHWYSVNVSIFLWRHTRMTSYLSDCKERGVPRVPRNQKFLGRRGPSFCGLGSWTLPKPRSGSCASCKVDSIKQFTNCKKRKFCKKSSKRILNSTDNLNWNIMELIRWIC